MVAYTLRYFAPTSSAVPRITLYIHKWELPLCGPSMKNPCILIFAKKLPKSLTASNEIRLSRLHISSYNFFKHTIKSAVKIQSTLLFLKFSLTPKLGEIWRKTCEKSQNFWRLQLWRLLAASFCEIRSFKKYHLKQLEKKSPMHPSYTRKIYFYRSKKLISSQQTVFLRWSDQRF